MPGPETTTSSSSTATDTAPPQDAGARRPGGDTFTPGGPEIEATDQAMGANMVHEMNVVNGLDGGQYDLNHGVKYSYNREAEVRRARKPELWNDNYRMGHHYGDQFTNPWELGSFMRFELKKGQSASAGIKAWLAGVTVAECNSAVVAMEIDTYRKAVGDTKFDSLHGSADAAVDKNVSQRLVIKPGTDGTPVGPMMKSTDLATLSRSGGRDQRTGSATEEEKESMLIPGQWYYFYNHPKYLLKHPGGAWQGENSLYMGKNASGERTWAGMGATDKTETTMVEEMISAYNGARDESDARALKNGIMKPDGTYINKKYDPAGGEFPDTVDANAILNDPPYTIGSTTRKGGFLPAAGRELDAKKVKAVRDS